MKMAKQNLQLYLKNILRTKGKGRTRIGVEFSHYQSAN